MLVHLAHDDFRNDPNPSGDIFFAEAIAFGQQMLSGHPGMRPGYG